MSLETWLDIIRDRFSPSEGQLLTQSLSQDPLVWQFIQDSESSLAYIKSVPQILSSFTPGKMAAWLVEQSTGTGLSELDHSDHSIPIELKSRAAQVFETTLNSGLPPTDLLTAGLLALTLRERRIIKQTWQGIGKDLFPFQNPQSLHKYFRLWRTPFACLFSYCSDFDDLVGTLTQPKSETISKISLPIIIHALFSNPIESNPLLERIFDLTKPLSIDLQLESLAWLQRFRRTELQVQLAQNLVQTKTNQDFFSSIFSDLESFEAVNPDLDPLEKSVRYSLPEDLNRLAAFYALSGNNDKANDTYQRSSDLLAFLKAQTLFQCLVIDSTHNSSSRWLEIIKLVPHSKQARLFYTKALFEENKINEAKKQLEELPQSIEKQLLENQSNEFDESAIKAIIKTINNDEKSSQRSSYFVKQAQLGAQFDFLELVNRIDDEVIRLKWLENYIKTNPNDHSALKMTSDLYEKNEQIEKAIELTGYLEQAEPSEISHKQNLGRLYLQAKRWEAAFSFLQGLIKSESAADTPDLERFAEAALRTDRVDMAMSICHHIIKRDARNTKALVLLGEAYLLKGDVVKAVQHMEGVIEIIPDEPDAWLTLAWLWQQNKQADRALETLKKGLRSVPNDPGLLRTLGKSYLNLGMPSDALTSLKEAYDLDSNHNQGKLDLALAYHQLGQNEAAYKLLETHIDRFEENPAYARLLGHVLKALDKKDLAEDILLFAAGQYPEDNETVLSAAGLVLERFETSFDDEPVETLDKLSNILQKALAANPALDQIKLHQTDIIRLKGDYQQAFDAYSRMTKSADSERLVTDWRLKYGFGQAAIGVGNIEVGLASLKSALSLQPSNLMVRYALAEAFQISDLPGKADEMAKSALKLAPHDLNNILWYAAFKTKTNDPDEAVKALKEALQINPHRGELSLWLSKTLITSGAIEEAHQNIHDFIALETSSSKLLHQAAYVCVHINDLELAVSALEKARYQSTADIPELLMDLAQIHALLGQQKKALDVLEIDQSQIEKHPQVALLTADLLGDIGQYDAAHAKLLSIQHLAEEKLGGDHENPNPMNSSPLLYTQDFSLKGYHLRFGQLCRALGDLETAQEHLSIAAGLEPDDLNSRNAKLEALLVDLKFQESREIADEVDLFNLFDDQKSNDFLDLISTQVEICFYQDEVNQATIMADKLTQVEESYPRIWAIQSRIAAQTGEIDLAEEHLHKAIQSYEQHFGNHESKSLPVYFRKIINQNSIAEAWLTLGEFQKAIEIWKQMYAVIKTQPLFNWRYLYTLITGAEAQQNANILRITTHKPGSEFISGEFYTIAETLLNNLVNILPQEQFICLKARTESAFTGKWPLNLNVDACLLGPEEAAAIIIGCVDDDLVHDILDSYTDDIKVLQAYGFYALRHHKKDAGPYLEKALSIDATDPINHALLAHLNVEHPEQALVSIETALKFWADEPEWHAFAADLYTKLGKTGMAEQHIRYALNAQPENADYWQKSALLNVKSNHLEKAMSDLEMSTTYCPDNPQAWAKMAEINRRMGNFLEAIDNIQKASALAPQEETFAEAEIQLLFDQMNYDEVETKAKEILTKNIKNESAHLFLAQAQAKQGKFEQANHTLSEANKVIPESIRITLERLKVRKDQEGIEVVLPVLISLAQNYPEDPNVLTTLTDWLIQTNRLEQAEEVAKTALRVLPEQPEVYLILGRLQRLKGKLDQAISHLSSAITLKPDLVEAYIELGKTYQERRDLEKAIEVYRRGAQNNVSDPRPYYYAGLALKDCKDYPGAEVMLKQAKKYSPDDTNIIRQLGVVTALNLINNLREAK